MLSKRFNILSLLVTSAICSVLAIGLYSFILKRGIENDSASEAANASADCGIVTHRLNGYTYVKPILYSDKTCESNNYSSLKMDIDGIIKRFQHEGALDNASVYLKIMNNQRDYICVNETNLYHPASLIKVPILITYLKMEEQNPGILNKSIVFKLPPGGVPRQTYSSQQIVPGKSYTIKEYLKYMVSYSDNNATYVLNTNVDLGLFGKMFSDFGLTVPDIHDMNYQISAKDYSVFLNIIYNAGYLTIPHSEFAAELLNQSDFKEGIRSGLPGEIKLVHKFGEWGMPNNPDMHQLSESGIVYLNNTPYILTVMTQGKDVKKLPGVIADISKLVYNTLKS